MIDEGRDRPDLLRLWPEREEKMGRGEVEDPKSKCTA